jgi:hypothetical protein
VYLICCRHPSFEIPTPFAGTCPSKSFLVQGFLWIFMFKPKEGTPVRMCGTERGKLWAFCGIYSHVFAKARPFSGGGVPLRWAFCRIQLENGGLLGPARYPHCHAKNAPSPLVSVAHPLGESRPHPWVWGRTRVFCNVHI